MSESWPIYKQCATCREQVPTSGGAVGMQCSSSHHVVDYGKSRGGYTPGPPIQIRVIVREDGLVSLDGPKGPWQAIITPEQIHKYGARAMQMIDGTGIEEGE